MRTTKVWGRLQRRNCTTGRDVLGHSPFFSPASARSNGPLNRLLNVVCQFFKRRCLAMALYDYDDIIGRAEVLFISAEYLSKSPLKAISNDRIPYLLAHRHPQSGMIFGTAHRVDNNPAAFSSSPAPASVQKLGSFSKSVRSAKTLPVAFFRGRPGYV